MDRTKAENEKQKQDKTNENDIEASNDYDSVYYSEVDANKQVGNIDTLVDDADKLMTISMTVSILLQTNDSIL